MLVDVAKGFLTNSQSILVTAVEVLGREIRDLICPKNSKRREWADATVATVKDEGQLTRLLSRLDTKRTVGATLANGKSTRKHTIYKIVSPYRALEADG